MLQTDVFKLIDGIRYLVENEQYATLHTQVQFSIPLLIEQQQTDALLTLLDELFPPLFAQHKVHDARQLLAAISPHVSSQHAAIYARVLYYFGHVYFFIDEVERAIYYYRQSLSYFMTCTPLPYTNIAMALSNLAILTEESSSYTTQLSYAHMISTFQSMDATHETPANTLNKYSFYYETCLRLKHYDEAYSLLQQLKTLPCTPQSREQLQINTFEVMYAHAKKHYEEAYALVTTIFEQFPTEQNTSMMISLYTIAIDCAQQLNKQTVVLQFQQRQAALSQQLQLQRADVNEKFPPAAHVLPGSTSFTRMSKLVNEALQHHQACYTLIVYDVSTCEQSQQLVMIQQLHQLMLEQFPQPIVYFSTVQQNQIVYVLECGAAHMWQRVEALLTALPFKPIYGYCHSSKIAIQTFEQLLHMSYAYIYYERSQKRKVT